MVPPVLPVLPSNLKSVQHYLKIATDYDTRDPPISYWCRLHAFQQGLALKKDKEDMSFLVALMDWLEKTKLELKSQETISDEIVAQAHIENVAVKLFNWADTEDRCERYSKNVVKAFYSAGMLLDVCAVFGELNEDIAQQKKYAKWRAAHLHNCINTGEKPSDPAPKPEEQALDESENVEYGISADPTPKPVKDIHSVKRDQHCNSLLQLPRQSYAENAVGPSSFSVPPKPTVTAPPEVPSHHQEIKNNLVTPEDITQAQKFCKYASSALTYEDIPTAIDNLQKALRLLQAGQV